MERRRVPYGSDSKRLTKAVAYCVVTALIVGIVLAPIVSDSSDWLVAIALRALGANDIKGAKAIASALLPSVNFGALFYLTWIAYDKVLWRLLYDRENFSGRYIGYIARDNDIPPNRSRPVRLDVLQTSSEISLTLHDPADGVESALTSASINFDEQGPCLVFSWYRSASAEEPDMYGAQELRRYKGASGLIGRYVSSIPRVGRLTCSLTRRDRQYLIGTSSKLRDQHGREYIGTTIAAEVVDAYSARLRRLIGKVNFEQARKAKATRDGHEAFHITIVSPVELVGMTPSVADGLIGRSFWFELLGVGACEQDGNTCYYIVCESELAQKCRQDSGLAQRPLHVTLGFCPNDIYDDEHRQKFGKSLFGVTVSGLLPSWLPQRNIGVSHQAAIRTQLPN